ncbi:hypothetical protein Tco_0078547 [Tanacetum coccineum]
MLTCPPHVFGSAQLSFDMALRSALERIVTASGPGFGDWQWRLATLPFAFGGLGSAALQTKLLRHVGIVASGSTFDDALCVFNNAMEIDFLSYPSEVAAPKLMKKMTDIYFTQMALNNAQTKTNSSAFRSMLEKHQLTGPNFNEWLRALKLVVRTEKLQDVFETPLPPAPAASADNQALADWNALFDRHNEVACLMLGTMSPKLYQQFENKSPQEMITELQKMYGKPPGVELQELVNMFHSCKQAEGQSVSDHVLLMKSYLDQLATLNYAFPDKVSISFILNSLSSEFQAFVQNYNMQSMEKTISEVHSLLIEFEKSIKRNKQQNVGASSTPHVMAIQSGRVQKNKP